MKFFIDSADTKELISINETGLVDGVTTNPTIIAATGKPYKQVLEDICKIIKGPVSAEVTALEHKLMVKQGLALCDISGNIVVKLPCTIEGIKACKILSSEKIMTNLTLCFSASQALVASKAGATFISPFVGRLEDISQKGIDLVSDIKTIYRNYDIRTEILVASIRSSAHVIEAAKIGADIVTLPPKIFKQLTQHPLTDKGLEIFLADWEKSGQKIIT